MCKILRQINVINSDYASNLRSTYYECDKIRHNMRNCADIDVLINQEIIHQDNIDYFVWDKKNTHDISIQLIHDLL